MARRPTPHVIHGPPPPMTGNRPEAGPAPTPIVVKLAVSQKPGSDQSGPVPKIEPGRPKPAVKPSGGSPSGGTLGHLGGNT